MFNLNKLVGALTTDTFSKKANKIQKAIDKKKREIDSLEQLEKASETALSKKEKELKVKAVEAKRKANIVNTLATSLIKLDEVQKEKNVKHEKWLRTMAEKQIHLQKEEAFFDSMPDEVADKALNELRKRGLM